MSEALPTADALLSPRQLEVLELMAKGLTNREIGSVLQISPGTAKVHVAAVIKALDVTNRTEAATRLHELGLGATTQETRDEYKVDSFGSRPAIAVLPFDNFSTDPAIDALADGIVEDLTTGLARWRWFPVIARNSAFAFKGRAIDVQEVSRVLGARYVVEGSLRVAGDRLRITVQVLDGGSAHHIWADQFECEHEDRFGALDAIVEQIVSTLEPALVRIGGLRASARHPDQLDAWESTSRGFFHLTRHTIEGFEEAARAYDRALALDPELPAAHSGIAGSRFHLYMHGRSFASCHQPASFGAAADLAARLDPNDPETHYAIAMLRLLEGDRARALAAAERATDLGPSDPAVHRIRATALTANGRPAEAVEALNRALRLSPRDPARAATLSQLAGCRMDLAQWKESRTLLEDSVREAPQYALPYALLALLEVGAGDLEAARAHLAKMQELVPTFSPLRATRLVSTPEAFHIVKQLYAAADWTEPEFED